MVLKIQKALFTALTAILLISAISPFPAYAQDCTTVSSVNSSTSCTSATSDITVTMQGAIITLKPPDRDGITTETGGSGTITATFSEEGRIASRLHDGGNGFRATTDAGNITVSVDARNAGIFMYLPREQNNFRDNKGATLTSATGDISVSVTNTSAILASAVGDSYGLAAETTGAEGTVNIVLRNDNACIVGRNGVIANTVGGGTNLLLSHSLIVGTGADGKAFAAKSTGAGGISATIANESSVKARKRNSAAFVASSAGGDVSLVITNSAGVGTNRTGSSAVNVSAGGSGKIVIDVTGNGGINGSNIIARGSGSTAVDANTQTGAIFFNVVDTNSIVESEGGENAVSLTSESGDINIKVSGGTVEGGASTKSVIKAVTGGGGAITALFEGASNIRTKPETVDAWAVDLSTESGDLMVQVANGFTFRTEKGVRAVSDSGDVTVNGYSGYSPAGGYAYVSSNSGTASFVTNAQFSHFFNVLGATAVTANTVDGNASVMIVGTPSSPYLPDAVDARFIVATATGKGNVSVEYDPGNPGASITLGHNAVAVATSADSGNTSIKFGSSRVTTLAKQNQKVIDATSGTGDINLEFEGSSASLGTSSGTRLADVTSTGGDIAVTVSQTPSSSGLNFAGGRGLSLSTGGTGNITAVFTSALLYTGSSAVDASSVDGNIIVSVASASTLETRGAGGEAVKAATQTGDIFFNVTDALSTVISLAGTNAVSLASASGNISIEVKGGGDVRGGATTDSVIRASTGGNGTITALLDSAASNIQTPSGTDAYALNLSSESGNISVKFANGFQTRTVKGAHAVSDSGDVTVSGGGFFAVAGASRYAYISSNSGTASFVPDSTFSQVYEAVGATFIEANTVDGNANVSISGISFGIDIVSAGGRAFVASATGRGNVSVAFTPANPSYSSKLDLGHNAVGVETVADSGSTNITISVPFIQLSGENEHNQKIVSATSGTGNISVVFERVSAAFGGSTGTRLADITSAGGNISVLVDRTSFLNRGMNFAGGRGLSLSTGGTGNIAANFLSTSVFTSEEAVNATSVDGDIIVSLADMARLETRGAGYSAVNATSVGGNITVSLANLARLETWGAGNPAVNATVSGAGNIVIDVKGVGGRNGSNITALGAGAEAVKAETASGDIFFNVLNRDSFVKSAGGTKAVSLTSAGGNISIELKGSRAKIEGGTEADSIVRAHTTGSGAITAVIDGSLSTIRTPTDTVNAYALNLSTESGNISVTTSGGFQYRTLKGIYAVSDSGDITVHDTPAFPSKGGHIYLSSNSGAASFVAGGTGFFSPELSGEGSVGAAIIEVNTVSGNANVSIANITSSIGAASADGRAIVASATGTGNINVVYRPNFGAALRLGHNAVGVLTVADSGDTSIELSPTQIIGSPQTQNQRVISATSGAGDIRIVFDRASIDLAANPGAHLADITSASGDINFFLANGSGAIGGANFARGRGLVLKTGGTGSITANFAPAFVMARETAAEAKTDAGKLIFEISSRLTSTGDNVETVSMKTGSGTAFVNAASGTNILATGSSGSTALAVETGTGTITANVLPGARIESVGAAENAVSLISGGGSVLLLIKSGYAVSEDDTSSTPVPNGIVSTGDNANTVAISSQSGSVSVRTLKAEGAEHGAYVRASGTGSRAFSVSTGSSGGTSIYMREEATVRAFGRDSTVLSANTDAGLLILQFDDADARARGENAHIVEAQTNSGTMSIQFKDTNIETTDGDAVVFSSNYDIEKDDNIERNAMTGKKDKKPTNINGVLAIDILNGAAIKAGGDDRNAVRVSTVSGSVQVSLYLGVAGAVSPPSLRSTGKNGHAIAVSSNSGDLRVSSTAPQGRFEGDETDVLMNTISGDIIFTMVDPQGFGQNGFLRAVTNSGDISVRTVNASPFPSQPDSVAYDLIATTGNVSANIIRGGGVTGDDRGIYVNASTVSGEISLTFDDGDPPSTVVRTSSIRVGGHGGSTDESAIATSTSSGDTKIILYNTTVTSQADGSRSQVINASSVSGNMLLDVFGGSVTVGGDASNFIRAVSGSGDIALKVKDHTPSLGVDADVTNGGMAGAHLIHMETATGNVSASFSTMLSSLDRLQSTFAEMISGTDDVTVSMSGGSIRTEFRGSNMFVMSAGGTGDVVFEMTSAANIRSANSSIVSINGINASTDSGDIFVNVSDGTVADGSASITAIHLTGTDSSAIYAVSKSGSIRVNIDQFSKVEATRAAIELDYGTGATGERVIINNGAIIGPVITTAMGDVFQNNGTFTGSGDMGAGDDFFNNVGTITLTAAFDMGAGSDTFINTGTIDVSSTGTVINNEQTSRRSPPQSGGAVFSSGGEERFRLVSAEADDGSHRPMTIDMGDGDDTIENEGTFRLAVGMDFGRGDDAFVNNGNIVFEDGGRIENLERVSFGGNAVLTVAADPNSMSKPLISMEGEISAEDLPDGLQIAVRGDGIFPLFSAESLPQDAGELNEILNMVRLGVGRGNGAGIDGDGNLFFTFSHHTVSGLLAYDALMQSGFYSARNFGGSALRGECGYAGEKRAEEETSFGGCLWASSGARYTRHNTSLEYGEDAYFFMGGVTFPVANFLITAAGGYESSNLDIDAEVMDGTMGATSDRFVAGVGVATVIADGAFGADMRLQAGHTELTARRGDGGVYSSSPDLRTVGISGGVEKPMFAGEFVIVPRFEAGVVYLSVDGFTEQTQTGADAAKSLAVEDTTEFLMYLNPSVELFYPAGEYVGLWARGGADILSTYYPETRWRGTIDGGATAARNNGTIDRVMYDYGAGFDFTPMSGVSLRVEYDGGVSSSFDTFIQEFTGKVNVAF